MACYRGAFAAFVCCVAAAAVCCAARKHNAVGILTKPVSSSDPRKGSFVGATVVRYLQEQGLYVVPLRYDMDQASLAELLPKLAGVLFTGGGVPLVKGTPYYETARAVYEHALREGDAGRPYPVFGICLGYELLSILAADDERVLATGYDASNYALPLVFTPAARTSAMFGGASDELLAAFQKENITLNDHVCGIPPETFATNARLSKMFTVLSTNTDRKGKVFVSTIEARNSARYPIFATQWHPECASWLCFSDADAYNSNHGVEGALWVMRPFAEAARRSTNAFATTKELFAARIDNYPSNYSAEDGSITWYFPQW